MDASQKSASDGKSVSPSVPAGSGKRRVGDYAERYALELAWLLVIVLFTILAPDTFFTVRNLTTMLGAQTTLLFLSLAVLIPLTTGDFDLSAANVLTLSSVIIAVLNVQQGVPLGVAILIAIVFGAVVGVFNGFFVVVLKIDPFIVTLGTGTLIFGIVLFISKSVTIGGISEWLSEWVIIKRFLSVPLEFYYGVIATVVIWYIYSYTALGRRLLFVGRGREVARLSGIRVGRVRWGCLIASSTLAAVAGVVFTGTTGAADPISGSSYMLPAFAACFLGATTITPGRLNAWGTFISVYFLATGITGLSILGVQTWVQSAFYGGALIVAVSASQLVKMRHEKRSLL
jgi:ribose transport system permease protein